MYNNLLSYSRGDSMDSNLESIITQMDFLISDVKVPRNIKKAVEDAKSKLTEKGEDITVRATGAIYVLDEVSNDINLPIHARTKLWMIITQLEKMAKGKNE